MPALSDFLINFNGDRGDAPDRCGKTVMDTHSDWRVRASFDRQALAVRVSSGEWTSWTSGEIQRYRGQAGDTAECVARFLEDETRGTARPDELVGSFAIAAWNAASRQWSVWTDLAGKTHVYYSEGPRPAIGTFSPAVYRASARKIDWPAMAGFFCFGFFPQDRTHYDDIKLMRPASRYDFDASGRLLRRQAYWEWYHRPNVQRGERDTVAEFGAVLGEAVKDQTRSGSIALPLSGGLDSRTMAALLPKSAPVSAYSYGYAPNSVETRIAGRIARARELEFHAHVIQPYLLDMLPAVLDAVEGFQDVTQARQADITSWLNGRADYVLAAHWGDVFCGDMGCPSEGVSPDEAWRQALHKFRKRGRSWLLENLCRRPLNGEPPEKVAESLLRTEFQELASIEDADFRIKVLKTGQWAHRWTLASVRMYQQAAYPRTPFLDPRVMQFFCTVPTQMVRQRRIQIEYLKQFAPDLARIEWQTYGANLYNYRYYNSWLLPKRVFDKVGRMVRGPEIARNWEVQFFSEGRWARLEETLAGGTLQELVDADNVRSLLQRFRHERSPADGYTVSMLLTFQGWLERFHEQRSVAVTAR